MEPLKLPIEAYSGRNARYFIYLLSCGAVFLPALLWWKQSHDPSVTFAGHFLLPFFVFIIFSFFFIAVFLTVDFADIMINQTSLIITEVNLFGRPGKESITRDVGEFDFIYPQICCGGRGGCNYFIVFHAKSGSDVRIDAPAEALKGSFFWNRGKYLRDYAQRLGDSIKLKVQSDARN